MKSQRVLLVILGLCIGSAATQIGSNAADDVATVRRAAEGWRREHRIIDLQAFLAWSPTATSTAHTPARFGYLEFEE